MDPQEKQLKSIKDFKTIGHDGSTLHPWFEVTKDGELICMNEFAARMAAGTHCHVIQIDDH